MNDKFALLVNALHELYLNARDFADLIVLLLLASGAVGGFLLARWIWLLRLRLHRLPSVPPQPEE
jgi:hypothetical protein